MIVLPQKKYGVVLSVTKSTVLFFLISTLCLSLLFVPLLKAKADIVTVFPGLYSVTGSPVDGLEDHVQYEVTWNNFSNAVPVDAEIHHTLLKFSWSFTEGTIETIPETQTEVPSDNNLAPIETEIETEDTNVEGTVPVVEENAQPSIIEEPAVPEIIEPDVAPETSTESPETQVEPVALSLGLYPLAFTSFEEERLPEPEVTEVLEEIIDEVVTPPTLETIDIPTEVLHDNTVFEVLYSLNGESWENLGFGNFITPGELTFLLQQFSPEEMVNLQIMIRYTRSPEDNRKVYFDNVRLEFDYQGLTAEEMLQQESTGPVDTTPNFNISSVRADVESGNIRAVILEKGGMLELWYAVINPGASNATWSRLANDGSLDVNSPLGISGETIFWLDKNQQTLFGYDIKRKSLSGTSFVSDEERDSFLQFKKSNSVIWNASFDASSNSFEFSRDTTIQ